MQRDTFSWFMETPFYVSYLQSSFLEIDFLEWKLIFNFCTVIRSLQRRSDLQPQLHTRCFQSLARKKYCTGLPKTCWMVETYQHDWCLLKAHIHQSCQKSIFYCYPLNHHSNWLELLRKWFVECLSFPLFYWYDKSWFISSSFVFSNSQVQIAILKV